ncbi:MAG: hypothetical protein IKN94_01230 [Salinivirgaceae bacterium]|nr:hypothetical protein [Salinivirgaceae bacterium]
MDYNRNYKETQSQQKRILEYLQNGGTLTALDALTKFGCLSFGKRISEIVAKGYFVQKDWIVTPTGKRVIRYSMPKVIESTVKPL